LFLIFNVEIRANDQVNIHDDDCKNVLNFISLHKGFPHHRELVGCVIYNALKNA